MNNGTASTVTNEHIWALLRQGKSQRDAAKDLGVTRYRVAQAGEPPTSELEEDPFGLPRNIPPKITRTTAVALLVELATRPQGVKFSEMVPVFGDFFGHIVEQDGGAVKINMTDRQRDYLVQAVKRDAIRTGKVALIVPEWMPQKSPLAAYQALIHMANTVHEAAQEALASFLEEFPEAADRPALIFQELLSVAFRGVSREPVETRCRRNLSVAEQLEERGCGARQVALAETYKMPQDSELDALCI